MPALHEYASELREDLPAVAYRPAFSRLLWLPTHLTIIGTAVTAVLLGELNLGTTLLMSLVIGHSYACLAFLAHEILHGTIVRQRLLQNLCGGICFLPHCLPPDVWRTWHNRFHHGYTGIKGQDPDGFGDPVMYRRSRLLHTILTFLPGSGSIRSAFYFLFYFTFHVLFVLFLHSRKYNYWNARKWNKQVRLFAAEVVFWVAVAAAIGPRPFLFVYLIPLMIASYHLEHHLGPKINSRHAPLIHESMVARHGSRCRRLPLLQILIMTYRTPRVHLSEKELVDIHSGEVYSTLGPHGEPPVQIDRVPLPVRRRRTTDSNSTVPFPKINSSPPPRRPVLTESDQRDAILPFPTIQDQPAAAPRRKVA